MVDRSVFHRRLAKLEHLLEVLQPLTEIERSDFLTDLAVQAQAERWMHLAAECAIDLANHLIADRGWRMPSTNRETFRVLAENGALPKDLAERMAGWAGFRNILVHLYLEIDQDTVFDILTRDLDELRAYAARLAEVAFGEEG